MRDFWCLTSIGRRSCEGMVQISLPISVSSSFNSFLMLSLVLINRLSVDSSGQGKWFTLKVSSTKFMLQYVWITWCSEGVLVQCMLTKKFTLYVPSNIRASALYIVITSWFLFVARYRIYGEEKILFVSTHWVLLVLRNRLSLRINIWIRQHLRLLFPLYFLACLLNH